MYCDKCWEEECICEKSGDVSGKSPTDGSAMDEIGSTALLDYLHGIWRFLQPETRKDIAGRIIGKHGPFVKQEMIDRGMIKSQTTGWKGNNMEIQDRRNETWSEIKPLFETKRKQECLLVLKDERKGRGKFVVLSIKSRRFDDVETRGVFWDADLALAFCEDVLSNS